MPVVAAGDECHSRSLASNGTNANWICFSPPALPIPEDGSIYAFKKISEM